MSKSYASIGPPTSRNGHTDPPRLRAALAALEAGLWPVPVHPFDAKVNSPGKAPIGPSWGKERPDAASLRSTFNRHPKANVGLKLGAEGCVVDIDVDDPGPAESVLARIFPDGTPATRGWENAEGRFHLLFKWDDRFARYGKSIVKGGDHYPGLEIRIGAPPGDGRQLQTVIPPSLMANGAARRWNGHREILPAPESLFADLDAHAAPAPVAPKGGASAAPKPKGLDDASLAADALRFLGSAYLDDYHEWLNVGFSLYGLGLTGLGLWDGWSRSSPKYTEGVCEEKWRTMKPDGGVNLGSLFKLAERSGWTRPKTSRPGPTRRPAPAPADAPATAPAQRPAVVLDTERHRVLAETLAVLPTDPDLFTRGNTLVRIGRCEEDEAKLAGGARVRKALGSVRVVPIGEAGLSCRLTALADFLTWVKDKDGEDVSRPAHPPVWLTAALAENGVYPGVRALEGVAETPFPRADGSIVVEPGYDAATGVYFSPTVEVGPIPDRPTRRDAEAAAAVLYGVVEQFPFATPDDRAAWMASLLAVVARPAIDGPVPGVAFVGNRAGTGKGKLIDAVSVIATGRPVPTSTYPRDEAESDKLKVAFALAAVPIVHLDNLDEGRAYGGGVIDSALTSLSVSGRILGQSKTTEGLELRCCWFLSGNNVSPTKDAYRRWLVCNLVTELERPEERRDLKIPDLLRHVREHRGELVRAALVILRAHAVADRPTGGWAPLGSFEEWDRVVRGAVWYATGRDCNTTRREAAEESPDRLNKLALLEAWSELPHGGTGGFGVTSEEAHRLAFGDRETTASYPELAEALARFTRDGKVSPRNVGNIIRAMKGQNLAGLVFKSVGQQKRSALWIVDKLGLNTPDHRKNGSSHKCRGESGESGESVSSYPSAVAEPTYDIITYGGESATNLERLESDSPDSPDSPDKCNCFRTDCPACNQADDDQPWQD